MNMSDVIPIVVRLLIVALAAFDVGAIVRVTYVHYRAWQKAPKTVSLKMRHIVLVSVAHGSLVMGVGVAHAFSSPAITWRSGLYILGMILTALALLDIGMFQRKRDAELDVMAQRVQEALHPTDTGSFPAVTEEDKKSE